MTSQSAHKPDLYELKGKDLERFGFAAVRDAAFDEVQKLWRRRKSKGMKQTDLSELLGWNPSMLSKRLNGPANWTLATFGGLVAALGGVVEIKIRAIEDPITAQTNWNAYSGYEAETEPKKATLSGAPKFLRIRNTTFSAPNATVSIVDDAA